MKTRIPQDDEIAKAFHWRGDRVSMEAKFGSTGVKTVRALFDEVNALLAQG